LSSGGFGPSSVTSSESTIYFANNLGGEIGYYVPGEASAHPYGVFASTIGSIRYWDDGMNSPLLFFNEENIIYQEDPGGMGNYNDTVFYNQLPAGIGTGLMAASDTHLLVAGSAMDAYLVEIANPTSHVVLPSMGTNFVALSDDTAFVTENTAQQTVIFAYDLTGTLMYTLQEYFQSMTYAYSTVDPVCWNGLIEDGETCDGSAVNGQTCQNYGYEAGDLLCNSTCDDYDPSAGCTNICGNGTASPTENCDSSDLKGSTCQDHGFGGGVLACDGACNFDTSGCNSCGNNQIEPLENEICDGADLGGQVCQTQGFTGGTLQCVPDCQGFDTSLCTTCGDGTAEGSEACDGADLNNQTCEGLGFSQGTLSCYGNCQLNTSSCSTDTCGDGTVDPGEECDNGANNSDTEPDACRLTCKLPTCGDSVIDYGEDCDDGDRVAGDGCSEFCRNELVTCGNGSLESQEMCDGSNLNNATCTDLGYLGGTLLCLSDCQQFDTTQCQNALAPDQYEVNAYTRPQTGDISAELAELYLNNTLNPDEEFCQQSQIDQDLVISAPEPGFCNLEVKDKDDVNKRMFVHLYNPENPLDNEGPFIRFYADGRIGMHYGGNIKAYRGGLFPIHLGNNEAKETPLENGDENLEFLSIHPNPEIATPGRWLQLLVPVGQNEFCSVANPELCTVFAAGENGYAVINLDALNEEIEKQNRKPSKKGGCSTANGATTNPLLVLMLVMWFAFRRRKK